MHFLGQVGYYHSSWKNFYTVVASLTDLLNKKVKYEWSVRCQKGFGRVKALICNASLLVAPRWDRPFKTKLLGLCCYSQMMGVWKDLLVSFPGNLININ